MDQWQTYMFEFNGGLVSNLSYIQHGTKLPGSARILTNYEPSVNGGYRRIEGFEKFDNAFVPINYNALVQGSGQTGTVLSIANIFQDVNIGSTFTISGVTGTYTVVSSSYDAVHKSSTIVITPSLASSPADKAVITFNNFTEKVNGLLTWENKAVAVRSSNLFYSTGTGWTKINVPSIGTTLVNGASQTGTTLIVDGLTETPVAGYTFYIAGIQKVYTVMSATAVSSTASTLTIYPALDSSPADNASITWLSTSIYSTDKIRFDTYSVSNVNKVVGVDGNEYPFVWDGTSFKTLVNADIKGALLTKYFKNQLFFAKNNVLYFTAPFTDNDFSPANGAGSIAIDGKITGLISFREILFIFTENTIRQLTGSTSADFVLQPVTRNVGCINTDTIQEIGGDVIFLGPDGLRLLSATDRLGDFNIGVVSKVIQSEMTELITRCDSFSSVIIKSKSQYRLFGFSPTINNESAFGIIGVQKSGQDTSAIEWSKTVGLSAYVADSDYYQKQELILFANTTGYVYKMDSGNSFDGLSIKSIFATPYVTINDPRIRKTFYKLFIYTEPEGGFEVNANLKYDIDSKNIVQPPAINISNEGEALSFYGEDSYGTAYYGDKLVKLFSTNVIGSGFNVSLVFETDGIVAPFILDAATLEFSTHDRR